MNDASLLAAHGISRRNPRGGWLLHGVHLRVNAGDRLALIGPAGAGKSLLLRALAMLHPLDAGMVSWQGQPVLPARVPGLRSHAMYLHQRPALFEETVADNLRRPLQLHESPATAAPGLI
jgi:putative ABC transport system ATP-binding protein